MKQWQKKLLKVSAIAGAVAWVGTVGWGGGSALADQPSPSEVTHG